MNNTIKAMTAVLVAAVLVGCAGHGRLRTDLPDHVETQPAEFYRLGECAEAVYETDPMVTNIQGGFTAANGWEKQDFELPETAGRACVLTHHEDERQIVVFRGTANARNIAVDLSYSKVWNEKLECYLHNGFHEMALEAWETILDAIVVEYAVTTTGHSLGGAVAVIFGMGLMAHDYDLEAVVTFGQPKVTNQEGAERWDTDMAMPLTRVVHSNDSVAVLPMVKPSDIWQHGTFWQFGTMCHIDDNGTFEILTSAAARDSGHTSYWTEIIHGDRIPLTGLFSHPMSGYLKALWKWVPSELKVVPVEEVAADEPEEEMVEVADAVE